MRRYSFKAFLLIIFFSYPALIAYPEGDCFFIEGHAGIAPTVWTNRAQFTAISCTASTIVGLASPVVDLFKMPQFNNLFKLSWIVGGKVGYNIQECDQIFLEANYRRAGHKRFNVTNNGISLDIPSLDNVTFLLAMNNDFRAIDAYVGIRHYFATCWCVDYFIGAKAGLVYHQKVDFIFSTNSLSVPFPNGPFVSSVLPFFNSSTSFAGGLMGGFHFDMGCNMNIVITAELVATCSPPGAIIPFDVCTTTIEINPVIAPNNFIIGSLGTELFFPITIGFLYNF